MDLWHSTKEGRTREFGRDFGHLSRLKMLLNRPCRSGENIQTCLSASALYWLKQCSESTLEAVKCRRRKNSLGYTEYVK